MALSKSKTKSYLKDSNAKSALRSMTSTTTLMWCVVGLILSSYMTTLVTANPKSQRKNPHQDNQFHKIDILSSSLQKLINSDEGSPSCTDQQWDLVGSDVDGDAEGDWFGSSVALSADGTVLVVGAPYNDGPGGSATWSGAVKIFAKDTSSPLGWVQLGKTLYGDAAFDWAGWSVAISADGEVVAFGAFGNDSNGADSGQVKVYERDTSTELGWSQIGSNIEGEAPGDNSGWSIALSANGQVLAIGAIYNTGKGIHSGHVSIFRRDSSVLGWSQVGQDLTGNAAYDRAGLSVDLSSDGTIVAFGCPYANSKRGYVKIFKQDASASLGWIQQGDDIVGQATGDWFGRSVSLSGLGDIIAIGGNGGDGNGKSSGHVRVFQHDSASSSGWSQLGNDVEGVAAGDNSGVAVAISYSGDIVAIGANGNDGGGTRSGHTRVYKRDPTSLLGWIQLGKNIDGESSGDESGWSVALSANGHVLASGARSNDNENGESGHVRVYKTLCKNAPTNMLTSEVSKTPPPEHLLDHVVEGGIMKRDLEKSANTIFATTESLSLGHGQSKTEDMSDTELSGASPEVDEGTSSAFGIFYGSVVTVLLMTAVTSMMRMIG